MTRKPKPVEKKIGFSVGDMIKSKTYGIYGKVLEIRDTTYHIKGNLMGYGWGAGSFYDNNECDIRKEDAMAYDH